MTGDPRRREGCFSCFSHHLLLPWVGSVPPSPPAFKLAAAPSASPGLAQVYPQPRQAVQGRGWNEVGDTMAQIEEGRQERKRPVCGADGGPPALPHPLEIQGICGCGSKSWRGGQLQPQLLPGAFQPCGSLEPRRDWPRASPEWKCTSEKDPAGDPAGDPGEGSLPSLKQVSPSLPLLSDPMSKLCVQRGRGMLERSTEDCGGGRICGLPGNKCTQKVGGAVAGRSPTVGGHVGVPLRGVSNCVVWVLGRGACVCDVCACAMRVFMCMCVCVCVCVCARARAQAPVRGCPRVSLRFCWE